MIDKCDDNHQAPTLRIAVLEERIRGRDEALKLQADEYKRRMDELNHSHSRAEQRNADFLPRTIHEAFALELREWRTNIDKERAATMGSKAAYISIASISISLISLAAVLYGIYLS